MARTDFSPEGRDRWGSRAIKCQPASLKKEENWSKIWPEIQPWWGAFQEGPLLVTPNMAGVSKVWLVSPPSLGGRAPCLEAHEVSTTPRPFEGWPKGGRSPQATAQWWRKELKMLGGLERGNLYGGGYLRLLVYKIWIWEENVLGYRYHRWSICQDYGWPQTGCTIDSCNDMYGTFCHFWMGIHSSMHICYQSRRHVMILNEL